MRILLGFLAIFFYSSLSAENLRGSKPNIIFIMADDLGWGDVGFNGSNYFETPNLDELASGSMNFTQAYMYPTCSPSRTALMTGKHSFRTQVYTVPVLERNKRQDGIYSRWTVELKHKFFSQPLNDAGYKLIHLGKWHVVGPNPDLEKNYPFKKKLAQPANGSTHWIEKHKTEYKAYYPKGKGFHENVGGTWWGDPARGYDKGYKDPSGGYRAPFKNPFIDEQGVKKDDWLTDHLTNETMRFIKKNKEEPFFVNLHYYSPHRPSVYRNEELLNKYKNKPADEKNGQSAKSTKETAAYATMVENIDYNVGRLLKFLDDEKLRENTIIIFTSDNGFNGGQTTYKNLRGAKGYVYEGGIRVPMLVNWPDKIKAGQTDQYIQGLDYFPTFLELAGVRKQYTDVLDGESILPAINGLKNSNRTLFWHIASEYKNKACTMSRKGDWKFIQFLVSKKTELYNLKEDPLESKNLSQTYPEKLQECLKEMNEWRAKNKVPMPPAAK
ncbi:MAG: sulfatase [Lentisphaeraceae bacterium]|nr:sulfatase [Lentisphaeraceae bacterium]